MLYGCSPFADQSAEQLGLKPVMTLTSEIIATQHLQPGERVGYGFGYEAIGEMTIGIVACGYADGYPRHASTGTPVLVNGKRTRIVGRVSMDMISVDISDIPEAYIGSPVTLWGEGLSADEVGAAAGTLSYELLCKLTARVPVSRESRDAKPKTAYVCAECGATALQWFGACPSCGAAGHLDRNRRPSAAACGATAQRHRRSRLPMYNRATRSASPPASASSTARSAAAWWRGRWRCSAAIRALASPRCCFRP